MLAKRIIPCLDVRDGRVVKGVNFVQIRDAGDPVELARYYSDQGADEIVFLDITATSDGRATVADVVERTAEQEEMEMERILPWPDDDTLYTVVYHGHQLLTEEPAALRGHREELRFVYDGPAVNVSSWFDVVCESGPVGGNVTAGGDVKCGEVGGSVTADGDVACDAVGSGVQAGGDVHCAGVEGNVIAGGDVACGGVTGDVRSGGDVACGSVGGSVRAGGDVVCRKGGDGFVFTTGERNVEVSDVAETVEDIRQTAKGLKDSLREMFRRKPSEEE